MPPPTETGAQDPPSSGGPTTGRQDTDKKLHGMVWVALVGFACTGAFATLNGYLDLHWGPRFAAIEQRLDSIERAQTTGADELAGLMADVLEAVKNGTGSGAP